MSNFYLDQGRTRVFGCGILPVCRSRKPAENADPGKKGHLGMETNYSAILHDGIPFAREMSHCLYLVNIRVQIPGLGLPFIFQ